MICIRFIISLPRLVGKEGRFPTAFLLVAALALSALLLTATGHSAASADNRSTIGFEMVTADTPASSAGDGERCISVGAGQEFNADVIVTNVDSLTAWELRVDYDPSIVSLDSADYNFLLVKTGSQVFPSEFEQEKPGRMFLAAAETSSPDSGSGTLARLHMKALSSGASSLKITTNPAYFGPRLTGARGATIGDTNGDGIFDGAVTDGNVEVGRSCADSAPGPTPRPGQASPTPGSRTSNPTPVSGGSGSGGGASTPGNPGSANGDGNGNDQDTGPASSPIVENAGSIGSSGPETSSGPQAGEANTQGDAGNSPGQTPQGQGDGSSLALIIIIAGAIAALAVLIGAGLLIGRLPWTQRRQ